MKHSKLVPCSLVIIQNPRKEILLMLRDNKKEIAFPNHWSLIGGKVEESEEASEAAIRELDEELENIHTRKWHSELKFLFKIGNETSLEHVFFVYTDLLDTKGLRLKEGQKIEFYSEEEISKLESIAPHHFQIMKHFFENSDSSSL